MRTTISSEWGAISLGMLGLPSGEADVRSQTLALHVPHVGSAYNGLLLTTLTASDE